MQNVTVSAPKSEMLFTQYGFVSFAEWCACEVDRINRSVGRKVAKVVADGDSCYVVRVDRNDDDGGEE